MSELEQESVSERELAEYLAENVFGQQPRSPGEAAAAADDVPDPEPDPEPPPGEITVTDTREQPEQPEEPETAPAPEPDLTGAEEAAQEPEGDAELEDENVVWAKKRFGDDTEKWAKILRDQDRMVSSLGAEKKQAEAYAQQAIEYAQAVEAQAQQSAQQMPFSQQEEDWVERSLTDPLGYARAAAYNGNVPLFQAVLGRIAQEDAAYAAQVGSQVQIEMAQLVQEQEQQQNGQQQQPLDQALMESFQRLHLDPEEAIAAITEQVQLRTEDDPYRIALLAGDPWTRDMAVRAMVELAGSGNVVRRRDDQRAQRIKREGELRREAAGVVTGSPHTPPPKQNPFLESMTDEWRARGQWSDE